MSLSARLHYFSNYGKIASAAAAAAATAGEWLLVFHSKPDNVSVNVGENLIFNHIPAPMKFQLTYTNRFPIIDQMNNFLAAIDFLLIAYTRASRVVISNYNTASILVIYEVDSTVGKACGKE